MFFLWKGNGKGIPEYGTLSWNWRSCDVKNAKKLKEVVEYAPLEQLVLETDSPYLSPEPNRGKRNSSLNLPYVAAMIAELKGISGEEVIAVTEENAKRLLFRK